MGNAVIKQAGYILAHAPDVAVWHGASVRQAKKTHPEDAWLSLLPDRLRTYQQVVNYQPHQCFIGNITPEQLGQLPRPWGTTVPGSPAGQFGEIYDQKILYALLCYVDAFSLTVWQTSFIEEMAEPLSKHRLLASRNLLKEAVTLSDDELAILVNLHAAPLYVGSRLVGCVKAAHEIDVNLSANVMLENLVTKASAVLAGWQISDELLEQVEYVIECSEEAVGDVNQRGGGNLAKAVAQSLNCNLATGIDMRGFCAGPVHALVNAAALVQSGVYKQVLVVAGGSVAKLAMNGRDHILQGLPLLEDMIGGFAFLIGSDDGISPVINTQVTGRHTVGTGSSPQAVMASLISRPLKAAGMTTTDVDKYSAELQNPEITQPAGAGNVPEANYKMIAALSVMEGWLERSELNQFVARHGMPGFAPTQGHIPSGVPYIGHGINEILTRKIQNFMVIGKGSLFLGRMTSLFDGISVLIECNKGEKDTMNEQPRVAASMLADAMRQVADVLDCVGEKHA